MAWKDMSLKNQYCCLLDRYPTTFEQQKSQYTASYVLYSHTKVITWCLYNTGYTYTFYMIYDAQLELVY